MTQPLHEDPRVAFALREIKERYGDTCIADVAGITVFGIGDSFATDVAAEVSTLVQNEIFLTDNLITHITSDDAGDTSEVIVTGLTLNNDILAMVPSETVTLNGQSKVALATPLARCTNLLDNGAVNAAGRIMAIKDVAVTGGAPSSADDIYCEIVAGEGISLKTGRTVPHDRYFIITGWWGDVLKSTNSYADFRLRVKPYNKAYVNAIYRSCSRDKRLDQKFGRLPFLQPGSEMTIQAIAGTNNTAISAGYDGIWAIKTSNG